MTPGVFGSGLVATLGHHIPALLGIAAIGALLLVLLHAAVGRPTPGQGATAPSPRGGDRCPETTPCADGARTKENLTDG